MSATDAPAIDNATEYMREALDEVEDLVPTEPEELKLLGRDDFLAADDVVYAIVATPELGRGTGVRVRGLFAEEYEKLEDSIRKTGEDGEDTRIDMKDYRQKLLVQGCVDTQGKRLFTPKDIAELRRKSAKAVRRIADKIASLSGLTKEDQEKLVKNSASGPSDESL